MTKLRGIELPNGIKEAFKQSIRDASDVLVLQAVKRADQKLLKGIRLTKQNVPGIKTRLVSMIENESTITGNRFAVLSAARPLEFLKDFAVQTLDTELTNLCLVYGRDPVLASLLLDERDSVWELAESVMSGPREIKELSEEEKKDFAGIFKPFFTEQLNVLAPKAAVTAPEHDKLLISELEKKKESLEQHNKKLADERKEYKKRATKYDEVSIVADRAAKENSKLRTKIANLEKSLAAAKTELKNLNATIAAKVDSKVHSVLHGWIRRPEEMEKESRAIEDSSNQDVKIRAEAIIRKQAEVDRHEGNRRALRMRFEHLNNLKEQVQGLAIESINPLNELNAISQELGQEINRLRQQLGMSSDKSDFVKAIMSRIGTTLHPDELLSHKRLLGSLYESGVLPAIEMRELYNYYDERMTLCYEKYPPDISNPRGPIDPVYRLKRAIADNTGIFWLLDGHNILFRFQDIFGTVDKNGKHTESSRLALSNLVVQLTEAAPRCRVQLFYDGSEYNKNQAAQNVEVVYSGGEGDHRADNAICHVLEFERYQSNDIPFLVTTDDFDLRCRAEQLGSQLMDTDEFLTLVYAHRKMSGYS